MLDWQENIHNQYDSTAIIEKLAPYITERRKQRIEQVLQNRIHSIQIAVEQPADVHNALAIVRTAEILGIVNTYIIRPENTAESVRGTTQGAFRWTDIHYPDSLESFLTIQPQFALAGACLDGELTLEDLPIEQPLVLLLGNEHRGLSAQAKQACDYLYHIPMYGMTESFNLSVSAGISLYELVKRKRQLLNKNTDLTSSQYQSMQAWYYLNSVEQRLAVSLFASRPTP